jgi:hypothetical protein
VLAVTAILNVNEEAYEEPSGPYATASAPPAARWPSSSRFPRALNLWKHGHPEFPEPLKVGKASADNRVDQSLYWRAGGYSYDAEKIFQYEGKAVRVPYVKHDPPDATACIFWLKNRRRDEWRDRVDATAKVVRDVVTMTDDQLIDIIRRESNGRAT